MGYATNNEENQQQMQSQRKQGREGKEIGDRKFIVLVVITEHVGENPLLQELKQYTEFGAPEFRRISCGIEGIVKDAITRRGTS